MSTGLGDLLRYTHPTAIVGDILKIRATDVGLGDMALVEMPDGEQSLAQAIQLEGDEVSLQVFGGGEGLSTQTPGLPGFFLSSRRAARTSIMITSGAA